MVFCTLWDEGYYSNRSNLKDKTFYSQNVENYNNTNYNISYEVISYISADERKTKFLKYSRAESFYELDYDTMDRAIAVGAKYAIEAQNKGLSNSYFTDDNYMYYFNVLNTNNNAFGITEVVELENVNEEAYNEEYKNENSKIFDGQSNRRKEFDNSDINATENRTTSNNDVELVRGQQRQQGINERRRNTTESIRDLSQELDNSSFSNIIETSINEAIDYLGDDGKFDVEENTDNLYDRIYSNVENKLNRELTNNEYVSFVEKLKTLWEDAYYSNQSNLKKEIFSIKEDSNGNKYVNVDTDQDIFEGKKISEQTKIAKQYILEKFRENGINVNNENISVTSRTANEYTHPKNQLPTATKSSKIKASTELDNLLSISKYQKSAIDDGRHLFAKDGWDYYETTFKVGDNLFTGLVNIGKNGNKKTLYDITNIKRIDQNRGTSANAFSTSLVNSSTDNISQSNNNVKSDTSSTKYSMQENKNNTQELDNGSFSLKQNQLEIIKNNNPVEDDYHTWIRNIDDIKTFEETLNDSDYKEYFEAGEDFDETYTAEMAKKALETGKITVYSSYPIEQGIFVSPSRMEAESYSGNGKVYSKQVNINDVAWIDPTQGQYAKIDNKYSMQESTNNTQNINISNIIETSINEAIDYLGDDGKFDVEENTDSLYDRIYSNVENKLNRELIDNEYVSFVEKLKTLWEDAYYSNQSNLAETKNHLSKNALNEVYDTLNNPNTDVDTMIKLRDFTPKQLVSV